MQLYIDLDGVLANFDATVADVLGRPIPRHGHLGNADWKLLERRPRLYAELAPLPDAMQLWEYVAPHDPIILTGLPISFPSAAHDKREWVAKHIGKHVPVITCLSKDKCSHAQPGDMIIDDWPKYQHLWEQMGGVWITHTSAANSIEQLKERGL